MRSPNAIRQLEETQPQRHLIRFGLCGPFTTQPLKFRNSTAQSIIRMSRSAALAKFSKLCLTNTETLLKSLRYCHKHDIGCLRITNHLFPLNAHAECGYEVHELPNSDLVLERLQQCASFAENQSIRLSFSAEKLTVQSLLHAEDVEAAIFQIQQHSELAELLGADVIVLQLPSVRGGSKNSNAAFEMLARNLKRVSARTRGLLAIENSDTTFTPTDLLPVCQSSGISLSYNVHHHLCNSDKLSVEDATEAAIATWNREPLFRISSPVDGWQGPRPKRHHDYVQLADFPTCWRDKTLTVEVDAGTGELAVRKLNRQLSEQWVVYILRCADGSLYTGITNNPERRLAQHNAGTASRYTRSRLPVTMLYRENQPTHSAALKRELQIKALPRKAKQQLIKSFADRP